MGLQVLSSLTLASLSYPLHSSIVGKASTFVYNSSTLQVLPWKFVPLRAHIWRSLESKEKLANHATFGISNFVCSCKLDIEPSWRSCKGFLFQIGLPSNIWDLKKCSPRLSKIVSTYKNKRQISVFFRLVVGIVLLVSVSIAVSHSPSWALSEGNRLFLEAWRTIDRAYVDKTFNGQSWFRYRENALRNEPMNTREETYSAIRKMVASLNDPFTRFLEPPKLKNLRSGTKSSLTGVGLSIGYPTNLDGSPTGVVVVSAAPGGPASRAGILPGDVILAINDASTESLGIYDAADILQGPEGSSVELKIRRRDEIKHVLMKREKVTVNPVKSRLCEIPGLAKDDARVGYIKLASFTQNASGAVKEAIETLRSDNANAFVLDLRDNSGGLFPEGIEIAKIWLNKGVIVYICDSRGVRDIYDANGSDAIAAAEPLAVLVISYSFQFSVGLRSLFGNSVISMVHGIRMFVS